MGWISTVQWNFQLLWWKSLLLITGREVRWLKKSRSQKNWEARNTHCPHGQDDVTADELKRNYRELFVLKEELWGIIHTHEWVLCCLGRCRGEKQTWGFAFGSSLETCGHCALVLKEKNCMLWQKGEESPGNAELCVGVPHIPGARGMFLLGLPTNEIRKYFFYLACVVFLHDRRFHDFSCLWVGWDRSWGPAMLESETTCGDRGPHPELDRVSASPLGHQVLSQPWLWIPDRRSIQNAAAF